MKRIAIVICLLFVVTAFSQKKITELVEQTSLDSADVIPFVDISADTTKKILFFNLVNDRLNSLYALADSLNDLRNDFNVSTDSVYSIADELRIPNFRVIINENSGYESHGQNIKTSFIAGYESAGGTWSDSIQIQYDKSIEYSFQSADSNEAEIIIRSWCCITDYEEIKALYYPIQLFQPVGSNSFVYGFNASGGLPCTIVVGAGADTNLTAYDIEFHSTEPIGGGIYSSYSNGYIAGQLLYIADYLNVDLWTARYLARQTGHAWTKTQGYGKIDIAACIAAYDSEINYRSLDPYR